MFNHVSIRVENLARSRAFYQAVLGTLGYGEVFEIADEVLGFGTSTSNMFEIAQVGVGAPVSVAVHVAFVAGSRDEVRRFHARALALGGTDNGGPDFRPQYEPGYFAAFVIDPDGHNIEAVFMDPAEARDPS